jgi:hypothetical protein
MTGTDYKGRQMCNVADFWSFDCNTFSLNADNDVRDCILRCEVFMWRHALMPY